MHREWSECGAGIGGSDFQTGVGCKGVEQVFYSAPIMSIIGIMVTFREHLFYCTIIDLIARKSTMFIDIRNTVGAIDYSMTR